MYECPMAKCYAIGNDAALLLQAVLCRKGVAVDVSVLHKPDSESELERIQVTHVAACCL